MSNGSSHVDSFECDPDPTAVLSNKPFPGDISKKNCWGRLGLSKEEGLGDDQRDRGLSVDNKERA